MYDAKKKGFINRLQDPSLVWRFQHFLGVRKVKEVVRGPTWVSLESRLMPSPLPDTITIKTAPGINKDFVDKEFRYDLRIRKHDTFQEDTASVGSSGYSSEADSEEASIIYYKIKYEIVHLMMLLGSQLGDETFYALFFAFWFWNIDGAVGRRVMLVWYLVMYFGQGLKDIIRWPRPSMPPVVHLEKKWVLEFGMPSTHAMVGLVVPGSVIIFTMNRYIYPFYTWLTLAVMWCSLVCCSRLYLGMHSVGDILAGLTLSSIFLPLFAPLADSVDHFLLTSLYAPLVTVVLSILAVCLFPGRDRYTPAWGDTTLIIGAYLGQQLGYWINYQMGVIVPANIPTPYPIIWPTWDQYGMTILRLVIGAVIGIATRAIFKPLCYVFACYVLKVDIDEIKNAEYSENRNKLKVELFYKFVTYTMIGLSFCWLSPAVFRILGCERPAFYTEI